MGWRVGGFPSGDKWYPEKKPSAFRVDDYWRNAYDNRNLRRAVTRWLRQPVDHVWEVDNDNESILSEDARNGHNPQRPQDPVETPLRIEHIQEDIVTEFPKFAPGQVIWSGNERINAVICFTNALTNAWLRTYRNFSSVAPSRSDIGRCPKIHQKYEVTGRRRDVETYPSRQIFGLLWRFPGEYTQPQSRKHSANSGT